MRKDGRGEQDRSSDREQSEEKGTSTVGGAFRI